MLDIESTLTDVDFNILTAKEMRDVLKSKAHCIRAGFSPDHVIIKTMNEFRTHYISRVGMATYLSQMLGSIGKVPIKDCTLFREDGQEIQIALQGAHNQPVQRFIAKHMPINKLPFKVEAIITPNKTEERYL